MSADAARPTLPDAAALTARARALLQGWGADPHGVRASWNRRLRTSAGRAFWRKGRIELNPHLLRRHPGQIDGVLAHEAAHVAAFRLHGRGIRPHGPEWRALLQAVGLPAAACHHLPVPRVRRRRYLYLRVCEPCGGRRIGRAVRYGPCHACGQDRRFLVMRAPAGRQGLAALRALTLSEVRRRCAPRA